MRLIDADELFKELSEKGKEFYEYELFDSAYGISCAKTIVFISPTIDAETVRHGRWDVVTVGTNFHTDRLCRNCKKTIKSNYWCYCPNCGAKMEEVVGT